MSSLSSRQAAAWCAAALAVIYGAALLRPLLPVDETRYMTVAWEMARSGDLLVPTLDGVPYPDKPPLLFWLVNLAWSLLGVSTWAARLVPLTAAAATFGATSRLARLLWPERAAIGRRAALLAAANGLILLFATLMRFDLLVTACAAWALVGVALARSRPSAGWAVAALALGLGLLAKGPVVMVAVLSVALFAPLWVGRRPRGGWPGWYLGLLAALAAAAAIGLAWALPAAEAGGEAYGASLLWGQTADRVAGAHDHAQPVWFYLAALPVLVLPWLLWPPLWRGLFARHHARADAGLRFCAVGLGTALVVMSAVSAKQIHYLLPVLPLAAVAVARLSDGRDGDRPGLAPAAWLLVALGLVAAAVFAFAPGLLHGPAAALSPLGPLLVAATGFVLLVLARRRRIGGPTGLLVATAAILVGVHLAAAPGMFPAYDLAPLARLMAGHQDAGLAWGHDYAGEFGYLGRLEVPVAEVAPDAFGAWLAAHPGGIAAMHYHEAPGIDAGAPVEEWPYRAQTMGVWY